MIDNRVGINHLLTVLTRAHFSLGDVRERDNIWELTKRIIFMEGATSR